MKHKFPERLRELRTEKNINQVKLGKYLGFGCTAISGYESGRNEPSLDTLIALADYFDVSVDYLLGRTDETRIMELTPQEEKLLQCFREIQKEKQ